MKRGKWIVCVMTICCLALAGCGSRKTTEKNPFEGKDLTDVIFDIYENAEGFDLGLMDPAVVEPDMMQYYIGTENTQGITQMVVSEPYINITPYSLCLIRIAEDADVEKVRQNVFQNADPRKWICVAADKVTVNNAGNVVMLLMASEEETELVSTAFEKIAGDSKGEPLVR